MYNEKIWNIKNILESYWNYETVRLRKSKAIDESLKLTKTSNNIS